MNNMYIALNPGVYSDPKVALLVIETEGVGIGIVRQCNSWGKLSSLAQDFEGALHSMQWPNPEILNLCIDNWGPVPF